MFYLKRIKPIKLRLYTDNPSAFEHFKPDYAKNFTPKWLSGSDDRAKYCYGLRSTFQNGFCVPLWSDLKITTTRTHNGEYEGRWEFRDKMSILSFQDDSPNLNPANKMCFKIVTPWQCECEEDIHFVLMENMWSNAGREAEFISGTVGFKYQHSANMFFYINRAPQTLILNAGDTPVICKQLSERKLEIESIYDPEKYAYIINKAKAFSFTQAYMKRVNRVKEKDGNI